MSRIYIDGDGAVKTLFVEKKAMELRYERACLLVYREGKRISSVPVVQLERIVVAPHVALSAGVLGLIAEHNVALVVINSRFPDRYAMLSGVMPGDAHRRVTQYGLLDDMPLRLEWSRQLVGLKITRQYRLLARALTMRPDFRHGLTHALEQLNCASLKLKQADNITTLASLRGVEGAASAAYFKGFTGLFPGSLNFNDRNRRPPQDPVNACLSLSYTLFHQEAVNALKTVGLDPAIGCYHELYYSRESLACDLLEPVRPLIDAWLWQLFKGRLLRAEDFVEKQGACLLNTAGKQRFYEAFHDKVGSVRFLLRRYARIAASVVSEHSHEQRE
jgi:CRISPR-associated protein Cas1